MRIERLGTMDYQEALTLQLQARDEVIAGGPDRLFLLEHPPIVTLGKRGGVVDEAALSRLQTPVVPIDRGGFATWHGPGQLVGYLILDSQRAKLGIKSLVQRLGEGMRQIASAFSVDDLIYDDERPGVYRDGRKVGSLGLHLTKGVTTHGFSLNICNELDGFRAIVPCGYQDLSISTLSLECGRSLTVKEATDHAERLFPALFQANN